MLPKLDTFVLLTNEGLPMDKRDEHWSKTKHGDDGMRKGNKNGDEHWSKTKHGDDGMRKGNKNGVTSDDFRTLKPP